MFYVALGSNAAMISKSKKYAIAMQDKYFRNPLPLKKFTDFKEAEAEVLYHLGEILPLDIQPPTSVQVDIAIFAGQLVRAQRK